MTREWISVDLLPIPEDEHIMIGHWYEPDGIWHWIISTSLDEGVYFDDFRDEDITREMTHFNTITHWRLVDESPSK